MNAARIHYLCMRKSIMKPSVMYISRLLWSVMSILLLPGRQQCNALPLGFVFLTLPSLFIFLGHPLRFKSDHVVGAGYPEREPFKQCPACIPVPPYQPFPLSEGQDSSSALGVPQQRGFRHVSCGPYHGSSLVSWSLTKLALIPAAFITSADP